MSRVCVVLAGVALLAAAGCSPRAKVENHLNRGNEHFDAGRYQEAAIEYLNVLRADRSNEVAIVRSGLAHFELGDPIRAGAFLRAAVELQPDNLEVREKLGAIYRLTGDIPKSREQALAILEHDPDHFEGLMLLTEASFKPEDIADAEERLIEREDRYGDRWQYHVARAQLDLRQRKLDAAEDALLRALAIAPNEPRVLEPLGDFYALRNQRGKAIGFLQRAAEASPPVSATRVKWAAFLHGDGRTDEAIADLRAMVAEDPAFLPAWLRLGEYALQDRRSEDAREAMEAILQVNPDHFGGRLLRARLNLATGETAEAIRELEALRDQSPEAGLLRYQLGLAYLRDGKVDLARQELRQAFQFDPRLVQAALQLAELDLRAGDAATAIKDLEALIAERNAFPEAVQLLGRAYAVNNEPQRALDTFRALEELDPDNHLGPFFRGEIHLREGENRRAREAFEKALTLAPDSVMIVSRLAMLDLREEDGEAAIERLQAAIERSPEQPGLHQRLGVVYAQLGKPKQAEAAFRREIQLAPDDMTSYLALSRLLMEQGRLADALKDVEDGLAEQPDDVRLLMLSGMFHEQSGDADTALQRYERVIALAPGFAQAANNAAYIYVTRKDNLDRAFALAKQAREAAPDDPAIADTLGWVAYRRGEFAWALTLLREALESFADNPEVQYHYGMTQLALGNEGEARAALEKALELDRAGVLPRPAEIRAVAGLLRTPADAVTKGQQAAIDEVLAADAANPAARVRRAGLMEREGQAEQAAAIYRDVLEDFPAFLPALVRLIDVVEGPLDDPEQALRLAKKARSERPEDGTIAQRAGWLAVRQGEVDWGYGLLQEAARKGGGDGRLRYQVAVAGYLRHDEQAALEFCAGDVDPSDEVRPFCALVQALAGGAPDEAAVAAAESVPEDGALYVPAQMVKGRAAEAEGRLEDAAALYAAALRRVPGYGPAAREAARLYAGPLDDLEQAHPLATRAREALPGDAAAAAILGKVMLHREDFAYAARLLAEALRARPDDTETRYLLGFAEHGRGEQAAARAALQKALQQAPASPHAARAYQILAAEE